MTLSITPRKNQGLPSSKGREHSITLQGSEDAEIHPRQPEMMKSFAIPGQLEIAIDASEVRPDYMSEITIECHSMSFRHPGQPKIIANKKERPFTYYIIHSHEECF